MIRKNESGQALVLVLLSLSVVLTLILYILSRSVTDVAVSSRQEESVRAFSAAEAGIERALVTGSNIPSTGVGNASYTATVTGFASGGTEAPFPYPLSYGDTVTVWFVSHDTNGNLSCSSLPCFAGLNPWIDVCWGNPGTPANTDTTPAIELSVYYETPAGSTANIRVGRTALDPYSGRPGGNNFDTALDPGKCTIGNQTYEFHKKIFISSIVPAAALSYQNVNGLLIAHIRLLYNSGTSHVVGVTVDNGGGVNNVLPSQGQKIDSSGVAGGSNRRIVVYEGWPEFPFASNSILVPAGITK
jgi:hypothetical protein